MPTSPNVPLLPCVGLAFGDSGFERFDPDRILWNRRWFPSLSSSSSNTSPSATFRWNAVDNKSEIGGKLLQRNQQV
ncbi:hypothetical protein ACP70R_007670 [Stipagrostis hirtigluma subsp. patula]